MPHTHQPLSNNQRKEKNVLTDNQRSEIKAIQADMKLDELYTQLEAQYE